MVEDVEVLVSSVPVFRQHIDVLLEYVCQNEAVLLA